MSNGKCPRCKIYYPGIEKHRICDICGYNFTIKDDDSGNTKKINSYNSRLYIYSFILIVTLMMAIVFVLFTFNTNRNNNHTKQIAKTTTKTTTTDDYYKYNQQSTSNHKNVIERDDVSVKTMDDFEKLEAKQNSWDAANPFDDKTFTCVNQDMDKTVQLNWIFNKNGTYIKDIKVMGLTIWGYFKVEGNKLNLEETKMKFGAAIKQSNEKSSLKYKLTRNGYQYIQESNTEKQYLFNCTRTGEGGYRGLRTWDGRSLSVRSDLPVRNGK